MDANHRFEIMSLVLEYADNVCHSQRFLDKGAEGWANFHRERADELWKQINIALKED